ncbi:Putative extracellular nuclease [Idiomarina sp. A28L]|uniref:ExeM/NucH family extracellular endonuclease n=1 Tax=Idiomarina sp. A28L TaxID=1036674 RepID=UPI0002138B93|nr:ExeM/NucH family extracellular endonuclease [Idiomarina sp. A28L]EGN75381.1 Putative extracellular nuclease [Idiomarina sp. A28L]
MNFKLLSFSAASVAIFTLSACSGTYSTSERSNVIAEQCANPTTALADLGPQNEASNVTVNGVVHGVFQGEQQLQGFFIQGDTGAAFVQDSALIGDVTEGQRIQVTGNLDSYYGGWQLTNISDFANCGTGEISKVRVSLPLQQNETLDSYLFQRVTLEHPMVVIGHYQLARFGTLDIATERLWTATQVKQPGPDASVRTTYNNARRLVLDDGSWVENPEQIRYPNGGLSMANPVRSGDEITGIEGILVRVGNSYHIQPVVEPTFNSLNPRTGVPELPEGDLSVVAFNVLNYFNGDGQGGDFPTPRGAETPEEFERQRAKTIATMIELNADIYALMEMENDGFGEFSALADLTRGLNSATEGSPYSFVSADADKVGGDAITQAIIYRNDRVTPKGAAQWTEEGPFSWGSRPPLLQNFSVNSSGKEIAVVANHFKSKGSCPRDSSNVNANQNDGQSCWNQLRVETAEALVAWLASNPKDLSHSNYIVLGDFNSYKMEDPLAALAGAGFPNLANYYDTDGYSYVFRGEQGSLDHVLVHDSIWGAVQGMAHWLINSDEPIAFQYDIDDKTEWQQEHLYAPTPFRSSDHDPIITIIDSTQLH